VRSKLAEVELMNGDASSAERLYSELVSASPNSVTLNNLALSQELLGRYDEATRHLQECVRLAPDATGYLNLADCYLMAGHKETADSLYELVLERISADPNPDDISNLQMKAQCYAHLGDKSAAVSAIQDALRRDPDNAWTYYAASVVYTAIGENTSALVNAQTAVQKGVQGRWYRIDLFEPLREQADFISLVAEDPISSQPD